MVEMAKSEIRILMGTTIIHRKVKKMIGSGNEFGAQPGDVLVRNKSVFGLIDHYGIYAGSGAVIDNHPDRGVSLTNMKSFLNGRKLERVFRYRGNTFSRSQVVQKAYSMIGMKYDLTNFNCEHFVNEVLGAGKKSQQLANAGTVLVLSCIIFGLINVTE
jgi:hypothetical protein